MKFHVPDMSCGHCKAAIDASVKGKDNSARLEFDMDNRTVEIESGLSTGEIAEALKSAGYESTQMEQNA